MIRIDKLTKIYPNGKKANDNITLHVEEGEIAGIIGPNGAGKTTLVRQILGLLKPTEGTIKVDEIDVVTNPHDIKGMIGYTPQYPIYYPSLTVEELLCYVLLLKGTEKEIVENRVDEALKLTHLEFAKTFFGYQLSPGMIKMLLFAVAIIQDAPILILDEPTSMVDITNKFRIWEYIQTIGEKTILLCSHDMNEVKRLCDTIFVFLNGSIVAQGSVREISSLMKMPAEIKLIPKDKKDFETIIHAQNVVYNKKKFVYELNFEELSWALDFLSKIEKKVGMDYLNLESPSFEKTIVHLLED